MNTDSILALVGIVAIIILLSLWSKMRSLDNDFTDKTKKIDTYSEKQE
jgi:FtsZ-interacting cell division protein ZipA